jgi:hypothetical protein
VVIFFVGVLVASPPMDLLPTVMIVFGAMMAACGGYMLSGWRSSRDEQRRIYARLASNDATRASITSSSFPTARGVTLSGVPEATIWLLALNIILTLVIESGFLNTRNSPNRACAQVCGSTQLSV